MDRHFTTSFYLIAYPVTVFIALLLNFLILADILTRNYMGLGMLLVSVCSIAYLTRLLLQSRFLKHPVPDNGLLFFRGNAPAIEKTISYVALVMDILWIITLFLILVFL